MAITPSDFSKIWASNADTTEYTFTEADYLKGWDFVGNLPPTRAQWNAIQKSTDEKMKYVFDNFGAPLVASTVAEMTLTNRVYVYIGSETGYTAGHWYYWDGSAWADGGVYNSIAFSTDTTLTISGAAADAKVTGNEFKDFKSEIDKFTNQEVFNYSIATLSHFAINATGKWSVNQAQESCTIPISEGIIKIKVTAGENGAVIAFLNSYNPNATSPVDFADGFTSRITIAAGNTEEFAVRDGMNYFFALITTQAGVDYTPLVKLYRTTDSTLSIQDASADAKVVGDLLDYLSRNQEMDSVYTLAEYIETDWEIGTINGESGKNGESTHTIRTGYIPVIGLRSVKFTGVVQGDGESSDRVQFVYLYDAHKNYVNRVSTAYNPVYIETVGYIRLVYGYTQASGIDVVDYGFENLIADYNLELTPFNYAMYNYALTKRAELNASMDLDDVHNTGIYGIFRSSLPQNMPVNAGGILVVFSYYRYDEGSTTSTLQLFANADRIMYRYKISSGWSNWFGGTEKIPVNDLVARIIGSDRESSQKTTIVQANTLPQKSSGTYAIGDIIKGILYSSVWRDGQDVFRNLTLETYYSAMANPASVMYTKDYRNVGISNAWTWYGGVCSSFVGSVLGIGPFYATNFLVQLLSNEEIKDYRLLSPGDFILYHNGADGHIQLISQVYTDTFGNIVRFEITDQASTATTVTNRTQSYSVEGFLSHLSAGGYKMYKNTFGVPKLLDDGTYTEDVIYEYGNRTYRTVGEVTDGMWFYIPQGDTVYFRKDGGEWATIALSSVTTNIVNDVTIYNLQNIFNGVGVYDITTDINNTKYCTIKIIDIGTISVDNGVVTFSDYDGCVPKFCYMVRIVEGVTNGSLKPPDGYHCSYQNQAKAITGDLIDMSEYINTNYAGYKIWVDYDTDGFGYKQGLSNNIFFE